ncbi:MAG TPA: hypothetical protein VFT55_16370 [Planctomycetota bacterium]|nr:hypothetical protein [Planctomycetota bacterium]
MNRSIASSLSVLLAALAVAQEHPLTRQPSQSLDAAWQEALTLARTHKAPLLAFVLPPRDEPADAARHKATRAREMEVGMLWRKGNDVPAMVTARDVLLRQVQMLRTGRPAGPREPFRATEAQAVFAMTVPVFATASVCGSKPGETVVLFGADGKRMRGFALDLLDAAAFVREIGGEVVSPQALAVRTANPAPELTRLLERRRSLLATPPQDEAAVAEHQQVFRQLVSALPGAAPAMVHREDGKLVIDPDLGVLEQARAPLGSTAEQLAGDPCPPCGMGFVPPQFATVLKLLGP